MTKDTKDETKNVPPPTSAEDQGRVTAETVVTEGEVGIERLKEAVRRIIKAPNSKRPKSPLRPPG